MKAILLILLGVILLPAYADKPVLEDQFFGKSLKLKDVEVTVLPNGTIGAASYKGQMLWDKLFCLLCTSDWQPLGCTANPLEKPEEPRMAARTVKDGVQIVSSGVIGDPHGGRWRYIQTLTFTSNSQLEVRFNIKPFIPPKKPVLFLMIKMEMPTFTYAQAPLTVIGSDGQSKPFPNFGCMLPAREINFSKPEPGWTVKLGPGIGQAHLSNYNWACVATLNMVVYSFNRPVELGLTCDFSRGTGNKTENKK